MTNNEIIKALECCRDCKCKECPCYNKETEGCKEIDEQDILDLINRQKAEIERLQKAIKVQDIMIEQQDYKLKQAKSEAIKEFWERLKLKKAALDSWVVYVESGDTLVKEMTEE